jgi:hypothetical protein
MLPIKVRVVVVNSYLEIVQNSVCENQSLEVGIWLIVFWSALGLGRPRHPSRTKT